MLNCHLFSALFSSYSSCPLQILAVLLRAALGRHQDQCCACVPKVCLDRVTAQLAVLRYQVAQQWRVAVLHQGVRKSALRLHLRVLRGADHYQELCDSNWQLAVTR